MDTYSYKINKNQTAEARAYFVLPENFTEELAGEAAESMRRVAGQYKVVLVIPDGDIFNIAGFITCTDIIVTQNNVEKPAIGDVCIFLSASRDLVVKSALCLRSGFESNLAMDFVESGNAIYMIKESNYMSSRAPRAYQRKIEAYERELKQFGVKFNALPVMTGAPIHRNPAIKAWEPSPVKAYQSYQKQSGSTSQKRRIITAIDIENAQPGESYYIAAGDIVTAVARETAQKLNIEIICR